MVKLKLNYFNFVRISKVFIEEEHSFGLCQSVIFTFKKTLKKFRSIFNTTNKVQKKVFKAWLSWFFFFIWYLPLTVYPLNLILKVCLRPVVNPWLSREDILLHLSWDVPREHCCDRDQDDQPPYDLQGNLFLTCNLQGNLFRICNLQGNLFRTCNLQGNLFLTCNLQGNLFRTCNLQGNLSSASYVC